MKPVKRALCLSLVVFLLFNTLQSLAASDITLTAVNDSFLPLRADTMPTRKNGELYVPYSVFTGTLGLHASYNNKQQLLVLFNLENTLNFSLAQGYVYDQNDVSYSQPAYSINGTTYVSVKLICGVFGLQYSMISSSYPVLRIMNDNVTLSDHSFIENNSATINQMVAAYQGNSSTPVAPPAPPEPLPEIPITPPKAEEKIPQPSTVYLIFTGAISDNTAEILDTLTEFRRTATFFLSSPVENGDTLRRMVSEGHAIGLSFYADSKVAEPETLLALLQKANQQLLQECGIETRLICVENGSSALSQAQRDALLDAGYRLWDSTLDAREDARSAFRAAKAVLQAFQKSSAPAVVRFQQSKSTNDTLIYILRYMRETTIAHSVIRLSTTPI